MTEMIRPNHLPSKRHQAFARLLARVLLAALASTLAVPAALAASTWANPAQTSVTLTTTTTGGQYTSPSTLAVGDTIFFPSAGAGGLSQNTAYYVISATPGSPNTYQLSGSPGGAKIAGVTTAGTAVTCKGVPVWDATGANNVQGGASWDTVPNASDAIANIANDSNGGYLTIQNAATVGTINFSANNNDMFWISSSASGSTLSALTLGTSTGTPTISVSGGKLLRMGLGDASLRGGTLKLSGSQGVILNVTSGTIRICSMDWSGLSGGITVQSGEVNLNVANALGSGSTAQSVTLGNASTTAFAGLRMAYNTTESVDALNGNSYGRIYSANTSYTLYVGVNGGSGTYAGTFGQDSSGNSSPLNLAKNGSGTQIMSGNIVNATGVTGNGASGTLILSGNNTYTGSTIAQNGIVAGIGANAFGSSGGITIQGAGTLSLRGDSSTSFVKASDSTSYALTASASGATLNVDQATVAGTSAKMMTIGALGSSSTAATYQLNFTGANNTSLSLGAVTGAASTAAGNVTIANSISGGGSLTLASYTSANTAGGETLTFNGAGATTVSGAVNPSASTSLNLKYTGSGSLTLAGASAYTGGTTLSGGQLNIGNNNALGAGALSMAASTTLSNSSPAALAIGNAITVSAGSGVNFLAGAGFTFNGGITWNSSVWIGTAGLFAFNGAGTGSGRGGVGVFLLNTSNGTGLNYAISRVNAGTTTLELGNGTALGTGAVQCNAYTVLQANTALTGANAIGNTFVLGSGNLRIGGSQNIELTGNSQKFKDGSGDTTRDGGAIIAAIHSGTRTLDIYNTGSTLISGKVYLSDGNFNSDADALNVNVDSTAGSVQISGEVAGSAKVGDVSGSLQKSGAGTLTLSGANTYTGSTTISAGKLALSGSGSIASPTILVATVATFDVSGVSGGSYALNGSGTLTLNVAKSGSTLSQGHVQAASITAGGTLNVLAAGDALAGGESFTLFNVPPSGTFSTTNLPTPAGSGLNWWTGDNYKTLVVNIAPTGAVDHAYTRSKGLSLKIKKADLMAGVSDPDSGDAASFGGLVSMTSSQGVTVTDSADYYFYLPINDNADTLQFRVKDNRGGTVTKNINITVSPTAGVTQSVTVSGGAATIRCAGIPGYVYKVQRSLDLVSWTDLAGSATNAPANGLWQFVDDFSDLGGPPSSAYYRTAHQ